MTNSVEAMDQPPVDARYPPTLAASWQRSAKHGLRRHDHALFTTSVSRAISKRLNDESQGLLQHAQPEMVRLYAALGCARWLALCVNPRGQIVGFAGDRSSAPKELQVLMVPGRSLLEAEIGTTAPGCALEERRFVIVERDDHFLTELGHFFCASAPILLPDGKIAGALDITGLDVQALQLASDMVGLAVRRIENGFLTAMQDCQLLRFHSDERLLETPFEGHIAVDAAGEIRGVNRAACQLLGLRADHCIGTTLGSLFDNGLQSVISRVRGRSETVVRVHGELGTFTFRPIESADSAPGARRKAPSEQPERRHFVEENPSLKFDFEKAVRVARCGLSIVLQGETGTGKEVFARAIHEAVRPGRPFIAINCAAIPEGLIEAELFGYAEGAFTGGRRTGAIGKIEHADKGTLLLDEIGDMSMQLQSRLLRVLQERAVTRLGDNHDICVDILLICATHRDLGALVNSGAFREDLYYRLIGYMVPLPPLRERSDVAVIIRTLLCRWGGASKPGKNIDAVVKPAALAHLARYPWPGNIRQLEQTVRMLLALRDPDASIDVDDLPRDIRDQGSATEIQPDSAIQQTLESAERSVIRNALRTHAGNLSATARALGISRGTLYGKIDKLGIRNANPS